jgi:S1-C subfamily serine protease
VSRLVSFNVLAIVVRFLVFPFVLAYGQDCTDPASHYRQGVVSLSVKRTKKETGRIVEGNGTGFVVSPAGYVLTADHLVAGDPSIDEVMINGAVGSLYAPASPLRIVDEDNRSDVALLKFLDESHQYSPIRLGNPWEVAIGAQLCSLGFSAPLHADYRTTVGSLSSLSGQDTANGVNNLWTTQLPSNVGESGAPVLHLPDKGLVAIKYGGERPGTAQNVNYIIPINLAQPLLWKYAGIILPHPNPDATLEINNSKLEKVAGDQQIIPVGGWKDFTVKVVDMDGKPVAGAKVAWRTPTGGPLTYVSQTDETGVANATNLYTFPIAGNYLQTATVVGGSTPTGFIDSSKVVAQGDATAFTFEQK